MNINRVIDVIDNVNISFQHRRDLCHNESMIKKVQSASISHGLPWLFALLRLSERHRGTRVLSCCSLQLVAFYNDPWWYPVFLFVMMHQLRQSDWHSCGRAAGCL